MSKIEWTDKTWNPIRGCSRVSAGCENCYAEKMAFRFSGPGQPYEGTVEKTSKGPRWTGKIGVNRKDITAPHSWKKPRMVFVNSMSDLFHPNVQKDVFAEIMDVMMITERHTFQILTKRPENIVDFVSKTRWEHMTFPDHMWIGTSVESNAVKNRIAHLITVPAKVRFLSVEPMLGPLDIEDYLDTGRIHWVIMGGESGPKARYCDIGWKYDLIASCDKYKVPVFVKQLGSNFIDSYGGDENLVYVTQDVSGVKIEHPNTTYRDMSYKGNDISKWPAPLQRQEFPMEEVI